jgi:RND superfamily putative drug exporter
MFNLLSRFAVRFNYLIIILWLGAAAGLFLTAPSLSNVGITDESQFLPQNTESAVASRLLQERFGSQAEAQTSGAFIVVYREGGLSQADLQQASELSDWLTSADAPDVIASVLSIFTNPSLASRLESSDQSTLLVTLEFSVQALAPEAEAAIEQIRSYMHDAYPGLNAYLSGDSALLHDLFQSVQDTIDRTTLVTIILVIILLLLIYRSPVAMLIPLATIGVSYLVAQSILGYLAQAGLPISTLAQAYLVVIVFGVGTDYCLFIVSRSREELSRRLHREASMESLRRIGPVIFASAITVIAAFMSLGISQFGMNRTMGFGLAIGVFITLLASLSLTPALISIFGRFLFWPTKIIKAPSRDRIWHRIGQWVTGHPWLFLVSILVLLLMPYITIPQVNLTNDIVTQLPSNAKSVAGFDIFKKKFPAGEFDPLYLMLEMPTGEEAGPATQEQVNQVASSLSSIDGVEMVDYYDAPAAQLETLASQAGSLAETIANGSLPADAGDLVNAISQLIGGLPFQYPAIMQSQHFSGAAAELQQLGDILQQLASASQSQLPGLLSQLSQGLNALSGELAGLVQEFRLETSGPFVDSLYASYFSRDRSIARINVILSGDPYANSALKTVSSLKSEASMATASLGEGWQSYLGGEPASRQDILDINNSDFQKVTVLATAGIFIVIVFLLRSLIAPLYMVLTVLLNYGTTIGITTWVFIDVMGRTGIIYLIPLFVFIILVALGADYNIFLVSRIREETQRFKPLQAVASALSNTGGVITACGIILAGTFATLVTSDLQVVFQIGLAIAIGIIVDTFVVRALLVPAIATLAGRFSWWPSRLTKQVKDREKGT